MELRLPLWRPCENTGLLQREGEDFRITERGMMFLHPQNAEERIQAVRGAAGEPKLFAELNDRFSGGKAGDELIRSFLLRNGFTPSAASSALLNYRETMDLVERECGDYDASSDKSDDESAPVERPQPVASSPARSAPPSVIDAPMAANPGQFRVSMTDEFFVDVTATGLNRSGVQRLIAWLQANEELVPEARVQEGEEENSKLKSNT